MLSQQKLVPLVDIVITSTIGCHLTFLQILALLIRRKCIGRCPGASPKSDNCVVVLGLLKSNDVTVFSNNETNNDTSVPAPATPTSAARPSYNSVRDELSVCLL
jgi:hypothetical protein